MCLLSVPISLVCQGGFSIRKLEAVGPFLKTEIILFYGLGLAVYIFSYIFYPLPMNECTHAVLYACSNLCE